MGVARDNLLGNGEHWSESPGSPGGQARAELKVRFRHEPRQGTKKATRDQVSETGYIVDSEPRPR